MYSRQCKRRDKTGTGVGIKPVRLGKKIRLLIGGESRFRFWRLTWGR